MSTAAYMCLLLNGFGAKHLASLYVTGMLPYFIPSSTFMKTTLGRANSDYDGGSQEQFNPNRS